MSLSGSCVLNLRCSEWYRILYLNSNVPLWVDREQKQRSVATTGNRRPDVKSGAACLIVRDGCKHINRYTKHTPFFTYLDSEIEDTKISSQQFSWKLEVATCNVLSGPQYRFATFYCTFQFFTRFRISCWDVTATEIVSSSVTNFHIVINNS